jgi:hypothetical protein
VAQLGQDEFAEALSLRGAEAVGFWRVCDAGYKLKEPKGKARYLVPVTRTRAELWRETKPLEGPALLIELANLNEEVWEFAGKRRRKRAGYVDRVIRFVDNHGLLGLGSSRWLGGPKDTVYSYLAEANRAAEILYLYEAVLDKNSRAAHHALERLPSPLFNDVDEDGRRVAMWLSEDGEEYPLEPLEHAVAVVCFVVDKRVHELCRRVHVPLEGSRDFMHMELRWDFTSLLGAAYLQMSFLIDAEAQIKKCKYCEAWMSPFTKTGRRAPQHKEFCSDYCRSARDRRSGNRARRESTRA